MRCDYVFFRVGLGTYSNDFYPEFQLGDFNNHTSLAKAILSVGYKSGNSYTHRGIMGMRTQGFSNARPNVTRV